MVKTNFGNAVSRLLWGGVCLSRVESGLLQRMVDDLPGKLRAIVEAQFESYNLVQREAAGREKEVIHGMEADSPHHSHQHKHREKE